MGEARLVRDVRDTIASHPAIDSIELIGSRRRGDATQWSDWDFKVATEDFGSVAIDLPTLVAGLEPLVAQWDRLSDHQCYMIIIDGPRKIDLLFEEPHTHEPPHEVARATLSAIDDHFWDWTLWLTSKVAADKEDVVRTELAKMTQHLLGPLGVGTPPISLEHAVDRYIAARERHERGFGINVPRALGAQVERVVRELASP